MDSELSSRARIKSNHPTTQSTGIWSHRASGCAHPNPDRVAKITIEVSGRRGKDNLADSAPRSTFAISGSSCRSIDQIDCSKACRLKDVKWIDRGKSPPCCWTMQAGGGEVKRSREFVHYENSSPDDNETCARLKCERSVRPLSKSGLRKIIIMQAETAVCMQPAQEITFFSRGPLYAGHQRIDKRLRPSLFIICPTLCSI